MRLRRLEQVVAVAVRKNAMLSIDEETTSSSQWSSAHFKQLNGWVRRKDEILVRLHEHKNNGESTTNDHPVSYEGNGGWSKNCSQVDPSAYRRRQLTDALIEQITNINACLKVLSLIMVQKLMKYVRFTSLKEFPRHKRNNLWVMSPLIMNWCLCVSLWIKIDFYLFEPHDGKDEVSKIGHGLHSRCVLYAQIQLNSHFTFDWNAESLIDKKEKTSLNDFKRFRRKHLPAESWNKFHEVPSEGSTLQPLWGI